MSYMYPGGVRYTPASLACLPQVAIKVLTRMGWAKSVMFQNPVHASSKRRLALGWAMKALATPEVQDRTGQDKTGKERADRDLVASSLCSLATGGPFAKHTAENREQIDDCQQPPSQTRWHHMAKRLNTMLAVPHHMSTSLATSRIHRRWNIAMPCRISQTTGRSRVQIGQDKSGSVRQYSAVHGCLRNNQRPYPRLIRSILRPCPARLDLGELNYTSPSSPLARMSSTLVPPFGTLSPSSSSSIPTRRTWFGEGNT
ncbi:hypothetical protein DM02DRAFT_622918 [Periconia macrospinosa]|uniref:Uncharacterized protein n=1 Tax=Periconia macrospinosa TaxID=97972 RepID=A0A2V1EBM1_9PLEO|nr:hypothetical protein DM02DRAFT_622918 [Periconia macrospinosa]